MEQINSTDFKIGQAVNFTNDNGVNWGNRTITGVVPAVVTGYGKAYFIQPTDTPWYAVPERCLKAVK